MRLLVVGAGASFSTKDVENGYVRAIREAGVDVHLYALDQRIERSASWMRHLWTKAGKPEPGPTSADVLYHAGIEALERALRFNVDGVLAISAMYLHPDVLILLRRARIPTGVIFTESPYDDERQASVAALADVCWTNERTSVPVLRRANPNTHYLPAAYDPRKHSPLAAVDADHEVPAHDVVFVGTGFQERIELLSAVNWDGIDLGLYGYWGMLGSRSKLRQHIKAQVVDNAYAAALYRRAKIGLNLYRSSMGFGRTAPRIAHAASMNPRAYELAACGVFQVSDARAEVADVFGGSVPTFDSPLQLGELLTGFLADPAARQHCAAAAREAIAPHTFAARAAQVLADLSTAWQRPLAKGA